ncbi:MAG TPA: phage tail sheath C-terminal domain-containing protein, partial [Caldimonas sp.]|nr:phage tail sheath C-terminal domain-containing protein [Caldimonas sp.]
ALRHFEGRGDLVWGARTLSSDPRWIYVSVRRLLIYLEHSIDNGTQWAAFEPNSEKLWNTIRRSVEAFLYNEWKAGALRGGKPEEAYSVRCDRTTMSQDDIDKGRLVCLVGVAPVRPSEFVILGIGQWTADASVR